MVLMMASCFKASFAVIELTIEPLKGNIAQGTEVTFSWEYKSQDNVKASNQVLNIGDEEISVTGTSYATELAAGEYDVWLEAEVQNDNMFAKKPTTVESKHYELVVYDPGVEFLNGETAYATTTVTVEWKPVDGLEHSYSYSIDGKEPEVIDNTSITFEGLSEGNHTLSVKIAEDEGYPSKFNFKVDMTGPSVSVYGTDRYTTALGDGDFRPFGRYALIYWGFSEPVSAAEIRIRQFTDDGLTWVTDWIPWDPEYDWILINDDKVTLYMPQGVAYMEDVFELGESYLIYIAGYDELGNWDYNYASFQLEERYTDDTKPEILINPVSVTPATEDASGTLTVSVITPNVKEYIANLSQEYFAPDNTENNYLMYLQTTLNHSEGLEVDSVEMPNYMEKMKDLSQYRVGETVVTFFKGFVAGLGIEEEAYDIIAEVTFKFGTELNGTKPQVGLGYDYYIRDFKNRTIDGIVVDNFMYGIEIPTPEELGM
jgi:hypothetical protein